MIAKKKAQAWGFDLLLASVIFFGALVLFYLYSLNYPKESQKTLDSLFYEGNFVAESILSDGYPEKWVESTVVRIGITTNSKINETKIENFYNMAKYPGNQDGYAKAKSVFSTRYEFFFNLSTPIIINGNQISEGGIGKNFVGESPKNLIKVTRVTTYKNQPATMNLYIWE